MERDTGMNLEQLLQRCAEQGVELEVNEGKLDVYFDDDPSDDLLADLRQHKAAIVAFLSRQAATPGEGPIARLAPNETAPLSFGQQRLWFVDQIDGGSAQYNLFQALAFQGHFDEAIAQRVLEALVARHAPLRTRFAEAGGEVSALALTSVPFRMLTQDIRQMDPATQQAWLADAMAQQAQEAFDLDAGLMLRAVCVRTAPDAGVLLMTVHHIAADGWSLRILTEEFSQLYGALAAGRPQPLAPLAIEYADYAAWQRAQLRSPALLRQAAYWENKLQGLPQVHALPLDRARGAVQDFTGATVSVPLGAAAWDAVKACAQERGVTPFMVLHAALSVLLSRYSSERDIVIATPVANRRRKELEALVGYFANTLVLRTDVDADLGFADYLARVRDVHLEAQDNQDVPFELLVERLNPVRSQAHTALFQIMLAMNTAPAAALEVPGLAMQALQVDGAPAKFDLTLTAVEAAGGLELRFEYQTALFERETVARMAGHFVNLLADALANPQRRLSQLRLSGADEMQMLLAALRPQDEAAPAPDALIHARFEQCAAQFPDKVALEYGNEQLSYGALNGAANRLAAWLRAQGVTAGQPVAVCVERSTRLVVALLAVLKAGGAYLPLDPAYPAARLEYMLEDSGATLVLTETGLAERLSAGAARLICLNDAVQAAAIDSEDGGNLAPAVAEASPLAYLIYTSGSTGRPKGVMVEHGSVCRFLDAMAPVLGGTQAVWLGLTAVSFDISVLEIFGALLGGARLVMAPGQSLSSAPAAPIRKPLDFSLFYFASTGKESAGNLYGLLLDGAKFADANGFSAVWTPERHFSPFGGVYPNPAVTGAAVAAVTSRVQVRAGSCVLPLNDPLKVAEDWSVIDNLSNGRVGLAFAAGWNPNDFALQPDNFAQRHEVTWAGIDTFKRFWQGEAVSRRNGVGEQTAVRLYPAPRQALPPIWITASGSSETFRKAGELGANVLTHLLGQTVGELAEKIALYRRAWSEAGHQGEGQVSLMLHTYIADSDDEAMAVVRQPFKEYLATSLALVNSLRTEMAGQYAAGAALDADTVLDYAFNRYFKTAALFGSPARCAELIAQLEQAGVTELACLIDFGVAPELVMRSLPRLAALRQSCADAASGAAPAASVGQLIARHGITHVQCTPSHATALLADAGERAQLRGLQGLLVGGEACPPALAEQLAQASSAAIWNMYGPTEATIWASRQRIVPGMQVVPIGQPLAHIGMHVVDADLQLAPLGVPGELLITGACLARGYWQRDELTAERFIAFSPDGGPAVRAYRTGDLVRRLADGAFQFLGRIDDQVKLRGFRIELGEIESQLLMHPDLKAAACVARQVEAGDQRLYAYVVPYPGLDMSEKQLSAELRDMLALVLPDYMVPSAIMVLEHMPMTANGKLDRRVLPSPQPEQLEMGRAHYVAPETATEQALAAVWAGLLRIDVQKIGAEANFFDLGGHSLLLMRLVGEIKERFGVALVLREAFESPTLRQLAAAVDQKSADAGASRKDPMMQG